MTHGLHPIGKPDYTKQEIDELAERCVEEFALSERMEFAAEIRRRLSPKNKENVEHPAHKIVELGLEDSMMRLAAILDSENPSITIDGKDLPVAFKVLDPDKLSVDIMAAGSDERNTVYVRRRHLEGMIHEGLEHFVFREQGVKPRRRHTLAFLAGALAISNPNNQPVVYHFTNPKETNSANAELQIFVPDSAIYHMQFLGAPDLAELIRGTKQSWAETESKWSPGVGFGGEIDRPSDVEETQRLNAAAMASAIRRIAEVHYGYRLAWMQTAAVRFSRKANRFSAELNQQRNLAIEVGKASLEHVLSFIGGVVSAWKETRKEDDGLEKAETYDLASDVILMQRSLIEIRDALTSDVGFLEKRRALYGAYALLSELLASAEKAPVGYTSIAQVLPDIVGVLLSFKADLHGLCEEATASRRAMTGESAREAAAALLEARGTVAERDVDILAGIITRLGAVLVKANGAKITRVLGRNDAASVRNAIDLVVFGGMDAVELSRDERMIYDDVESEVIDAGREDLALLAETPLKRLDACVRLAFDIPFEQLEMILLKQRGLLGLTDEAERFDLNVLLDRENEQ